MKVIVFTIPESIVDNEAERITSMLESGVIDRVHIRKPGISIDKIKGVLSDIPQKFHSRLTLHSNHVLLLEYPGLGWHFSEIRPIFNCTGPLSRSCHTPSEALKWATVCDYVTLSPVFDSISKPGYLSANFNPVEEFICCQAGNIVALGGVTPKRLPKLMERGYYGAAMLGYAWKTDLNQLIEELKCYNSSQTILQLKAQQRRQ